MNSTYDERSQNGEAYYGVLKSGTTVTEKSFVRTRAKIF